MSFICHVLIKMLSVYEGFCRLHPQLKVTVPSRLSQMEGQTREQVAVQPSVRGWDINAVIVS